MEGGKWSKKLAKMFQEKLVISSFFKQWKAALIQEAPLEVSYLLRSSTAESVRPGWTRALLLTLTCHADLPQVTVSFSVKLVVRMKWNNVYKIPRMMFHMSSHIVLCARPYANSFPLMSLYDLKNYKHIYIFLFYRWRHGHREIKSPTQDYTAKLRFLRPSSLVLELTACFCV